MRKLFAVAVLVAAGSSSHAADPPTYKCVDGKKVSYSDEPCIGATMVDTTPTRGLDKSTGVVRKGADAWRDLHNEAMADAFKPLLNETPAQRESRHRRAKLTPNEFLECAMLDKRVADSPARDRQELYNDRKRYRDLKC